MPPLNPSERFATIPKLLISIGPFCYLRIIAAMFVQSQVPEVPVALPPDSLIGRLTPATITAILLVLWVALSPVINLFSATPG
jgi:hypothetical protein